MKNRLIIFFGFFGLYVATAFPSLAPYRDSGEMAASAWTLGVSHPTGYPLYILMGRLAELPPLGNPAYRLMLLSALAAAAAVAALYAVSEQFFGIIPALGSAVLLGLNSDFWTVAHVQEMYSISVLIAVVLLAAALELGKLYRERLWLGFVFLFGLFLGNRLEVLLLAPGLLWLALGPKDKNKSLVWSIFCLFIFPAAMAWSKKNFPVAILVAGTALWLCPEKNRLRWIFWSLVAAALGVSIYAYLPLRSSAGPWLDWHHPATLANFLEHVLRTKYGGTLDLISENYRVGELFGANMALYARHLWKEFSAAGLAACGAGVLKSWRDDRRRWLAILSCWWWSGPVFLFLANMPPNPHAAAIVEPHYLLSDVFLAFWTAEGLFWAAQNSRVLAAAFAIALAGVPFWTGRLSVMNRRKHFFSLDYARNVFLCVPPGGAVMVKKDVQLYTLWYYQIAMGLRPDVRIAAQGLSGASWYQEGFDKDYPGAYIGMLQSADDWQRLIALDAPAFATLDADVPSELSAAAQTRGLLLSWDSSSKNDLFSSSALWSLMSLRGNYDYDSQPDFFTSDIISDYGQALNKGGSDSYLAGYTSEGLLQVKQGWAMNWLSPQDPAFLGYDAFVRKDYAAAEKNYAQAAKLSARLVQLAKDYAALPDVVGTFKSQQAQALMHQGLSEQRMGLLAQAEKSYQGSIAVLPSAEAHYDYAVLYWSKDWNIVAQELSLALQLDPHYAPALRFLPQLQAQLRANGILHK